MCTLDYRMLIRPAQLNLLNVKMKGGILQADVIIIIIIIIINVNIIVTLLQKNAASTLYKMLYKNLQSSSSRMCVMNHNWSATKQRLHPQSVAEISHHSVLSGDRIRQCETSSGSRHKDTDQCL